VPILEPALGRIRKRKTFLFVLVQVRNLEGVLNSCGAFAFVLPLECLLFGYEFTWQKKRNLPFVSN